MAKPSKNFIDYCVSESEFCERRNFEFVIRVSYVPGGAYSWGVTVSSPDYWQAGLRNFSTEKQAESYAEGLAFAFTVANIESRTMRHVFGED